MLGTFTIHHHPIWKYGKTTSAPTLRPWENLYHTYNITANFAGHVHNYERYSVKGIPYFVVGNGGGKFSDIKKDRPHAKWYRYGKTRELGYLKVRVDPANNTATAQEIFVASVKKDDSKRAKIHNPPIIADTLTFPLSSKLTSP
jgi:acid phosphatase type 7